MNHNFRQNYYQLVYSLYNIIHIENKKEIQITGLNERQLFGMEYMQYTTEVNRRTEEVRHGNEFKYEIHGKAKDDPEIEIISLNTEGNSATVVYHDLDKFVITHTKSGNLLDVIAITPSGWSQKSVDLISPEYKAPETHEDFMTYQQIDVPQKECVISAGRNIGNKKLYDFIVKRSIWNTLVARFIEEVGDPLNKEGIQGMRDSVLYRRQEVLDALEGKTNEDPQEIALKSYKVNS